MVVRVTGLLYSAGRRVNQDDNLSLETSRGGIRPHATPGLAANCAREPETSIESPEPMRHDQRICGA
jgi:hypothetical protein